MKITHVIERLDTGGAQSLLSALLPIMGRSRDVKVTVVVYQSVADSEAERRLRECADVRFVNLDLKQTRTLSPIFRLVSEVREADIVHAHLFPALYHVYGASLISGTPAVYTEHNITNRRRGKWWLRPIEQMVYGGYAGVVTVSGEAAMTLGKWLGRDREDIEVILNGIDVEKYNMDRPHPSQYPSIFGRGGKPIVMVSRFSVAKDHATLIRAARYLDDPEAFVAFAGEGETMSDMRRLAKDEGVEDRVVFLGNRGDIPRILACAEVGVLSTHWEGRSMSVMEMMAAGLPVVMSDIPGMREVAGDVGEYFSPGDERELAGILNRLLRSGLVMDSKRIGQMRSMSEKHSISATNESYLKLYKAILTKHTNYMV